MPKCEIFDRSDFQDLYTIKSLREGDLGVKLKKMSKIFMGSFGAAKFLTRMLSLILRSAVPSKHAVHAHQLDAYPEHTGQELMRMLCIRVRN